MGHGAHVHVGGHGDSEGTNRFELLAAIILGIAGIFTALASFEAGVWNGKMSQAYSAANQLSTAAAAEKARAIVEMSKDASIDIQAKEQLAQVAGDPSLKVRAYSIAEFLYLKQMSEAGYKAMGFTEEEKELLKDADSKEALARQRNILEAMMVKAFNNDLSDNETYRTEMLEQSKEQADESEKTFHEGVEAKETADKFELGDVVFAVSLFFTGISLVFHSRIRWAILSAGAVFLIGGIIYMATIHWTFS
jgi:hypothetical protein